MPRPIEFIESEDQDIQCATCRRMVKRAVRLDDRNGLHGLDCAAKAMGRSRSRSSLDDLEWEAIKAGFETQAREDAAVLLPIFGRGSEKKFKTGLERMEWKRSVLAAAPENREKKNCYYVEPLMDLMW